MKNKEIEEQVDENTFAKEALQCEIGVKLKATREEKNISPEFIIKELKFSKTFLNALEEGEWNNLPGEVYALGFLKQYANFLELDISDDITRIKSRSFELTTPLTYPDAPISPNRKLMIAAVFIFIVLIIIVNLFISDDEETIKPTNNINQELPDNSTNQEVMSLTSNEADPYTEQVSEVNIAPVASDNIIETKKEPTTIKRTYTFYAATNDVWLQVYEDAPNSEAKLLREVLLKKGQSFSIIDTPAKLLLTAGNARSLEILEGTDVLFAAGTLGEENKVLKQFSINP